jgi:Icc-related predicted phosphoesterase
MRKEFRAGTLLLVVACLLVAAYGVVGWAPILSAQPAASLAPAQIHLSWTEDPRTSMTVMWQTTAPTATETVEYGTTDKLGEKSTGRRVTYAYETGIIHEATLRGLKAGTPYFYRVGDAQGGFSPVYSFRTAPARVEEFTFTAFGDHGTSDFSRQNIAHVAGEPGAFHLLLGDFSYANGKQPVWDEWLSLCEPMTRSRPMMVALGNHENETIDGQKVGYVAALARLAMPTPETWYTFDYAGARFISFNSDDHRNPEQMKWLETSLKAARQDAGVRWLILFMHHPLYSSNVRRPDDAARIGSLRKILDDYQVDLVLCGHNHNYERFFPLRGDKAQSQDRSTYRKGEGVVFVTSGGGGKSLYEFDPVQPPITAYRESVPHYLRVRVPARGPLVVEALRTRDRSVLDRFEIADK